MKKILFYNAKIFAENSYIDNGSLLINNGKIETIYHDKFINNKNEIESIDVNGAYIAPGFIDTHMHGIGGYGVMDNSVQSILEISKFLAQFGTTSFLPTISRETNNKDELLNYIKTIVEAIGNEQGALISGIHLEGPFLSIAKKGAQSAQGIIPIDMDFMEEIWKVSKGHIVSMTVAPELEKISELIMYCNNKGIKLQFGHTNATYEQILEAAKKGINHATHMFNGMTTLHHRKPGAVGAALSDDTISCEIIGDGYHVHPAIVNILYRCKPENKIILVTDSQKQAKSDKKTFMSNGEEIVQDKYFYKKSDGTLVGSNISMIDSVENLVTFGVPIINAIKMASSNPANILNLKNKGLIKEGYDADLAIFTNKYKIVHTVINCKIVY